MSGWLSVQAFKTSLQVRNLTSRESELSFDQSLADSLLDLCIGAASAPSAPFFGANFLWEGQLLRQHRDKSTTSPSDTCEASGRHHKMTACKSSRHLGHQHRQQQGWLLLPCIDKRCYSTPCPQQVPDEVQSAKDLIVQSTWLKHQSDCDQGPTCKSCQDDARARNVQRHGDELAEGYALAQANPQKHAEPAHTTAWSGLHT